MSISLNNEIIYNKYVDILFIFGMYLNLIHSLDVTSLLILSKFYIKAIQGSIHKAC